MRKSIVVKRSSFPVGALVSFHLSGTNALIPASAPVVTGTASFAVSPAVTSYSETSAVQTDLPNELTPPTDGPGTAITFETTPLIRSVVQVGSPELTLHLSAPTWAASQASANPAAELVLFAKIYDINPNGTITLVHRLIAPFRVADVSGPVHVELPAVVHTYPAGDRIELVIAASDSAYAGDRLPGTVTIANSAATPNTLSLPLLAVTGSAPVTTATQLFAPTNTPAGTQTARPATTPGSGSLLPLTGVNTAGLLAVGMLTLDLGALLVISSWRRSGAGYRQRPPGGKPSH